MEDAGGYAPAALLLMRLRYWMPKARIRRDGRQWVARTRAQWAEECGLSKKQIEKALIRLYAAGLVERRWGKWGGNTISFIRPIDEATPFIGDVQLHCTAAPPVDPAVAIGTGFGASGMEPTFLEGGAGSFESTPTPIGGQPAAPVWGQPPIYETKRNNTESYTAEAAVDSPGEKKKSFEGKTEKKKNSSLETKEKSGTPTWGGEGVKAEDIAKEFADAASPPTEEELLASAASASTVSEVLRVWRDGRRIHTPGVFQAGLTPQSKAKQHVETLRNALPNGTVGYAVALLAARWDDFCKHLVSQHGWPKEKLSREPSLALAASQVEAIPGWLASLGSPEVSDQSLSDFLDTL